MESHTIKIGLSSFDQLINVDSDNVYPGTGVESDAFDYIYTEADESPRGSKLTLEINIPSITPEKEELARKVLQKYFEYELKIAEKSLTKNFRKGLGAVILALFIALICILISLGLNSLNLSEELRSILNGILIIACWVSTWTVIEIFFFDWWPIKREINIDKKLSLMDITFVTK